MRRGTAWRLRNNPLEIDFFERSSQTPEATETDSSFDPTEPVEMARNDEGNARKRLSDYARPVLQRPVTRIHAPLGRGANFRIVSHVMSMLPIFPGKPSEDPYRHVDELSQVCEINHIQNVPTDMMKMKLFPATLKDRAKVMESYFKNMNTRVPSEPIFSSLLMSVRNYPFIKWMKKTSLNI